MNLLELQDVPMYIIFGLFSCFFLHVIQPSIQPYQTNQFKINQKKITNTGDTESLDVC